MAGVYIHIPFCSKKCTYCNYVVSTEWGIEQSYLEALDLEIKHRLSLNEWKGKKFTSVYFGGGTPSKLPVESIDSVLALLESHKALAEQAEVTLECNPEDISEEMIRGWHLSGVNRISLGLQSTDEGQLDWMKRAHTFEVGMEALMHISASEISNYSVDLIFGLPGQNSDSWLSSLISILKVNPPHFSLYGLEALENSGLKTQIARGDFQEIDDDAKSDLYLDGFDLLNSNGYKSYELASFCLPGMECRHNLKYWNHEDYIGFGVSAHSMLWIDGEIRRRANSSSLKSYLADPLNEHRVSQLQGIDLANEYIMIRLRTAAGLDLVQLKNRYGYDLLAEKLELVLSFNQLGLVEKSSDHTFRLSREGRVQAEQITAALMA